MHVFNLRTMTGAQKNNLFSFFEHKLIEQAVNQHFENDSTVALKGPVTDYKIDRENELLTVEYKNGDIWEYRNIDCGAEGMEYKPVKGADV